MPLDALGFTHLPPEYFPILVGLIVAYLALVELAKGRFYRTHVRVRPVSRGRRHEVRRIHRRATPFSRRRRRGTPTSAR